MNSPIVDRVAEQVKTLPAKRPYQPLDVCRRIGCPIQSGHPPDAHLLPEPLIECRSTTHTFSFVLSSQRTSELAKLPIIVVNQELGCSSKQAFFICCFVHSSVG
jgi:hypothetical protein